MTEKFDFCTPVALFGYNRPDYTRRVLKRIQQVDPPLLLFVADGPKKGDSADQDLTHQVRSLVTEGSFSFEVRTNFAEKNLGLKRRISTGLNWVFNQVPEAIILEDDILPKSHFFKYCQVLLNRFRGDDRVMEITGRNQLGQWERNQYDYHFSYYGGVWGWATWSESWDKFDLDMELWKNDIVRNRVKDIISDEEQFRYLRRVYNQTAKKENESWDYAWGFARHLNNGLSVVPSRNLIKNIGFGEGATNTQNTNSAFAGKETFNLPFPLTHPPYVAVDREYDRRFHKLRPARWKVMSYLHHIVDALDL
jgi:hypothetical protein